MPTQPPSSHSEATFLFPVVLCAFQKHVRSWGNIKGSTNGAALAKIYWLWHADPEWSPLGELMRGASARVGSRPADKTWAMHAKTGGPTQAQ